MSTTPSSSRTPRDQQVNGMDLNPGGQKGPDPRRNPGGQMGQGRPGEDKPVDAIDESARDQRTRDEEK